MKGRETKNKVAHGLDMLNLAMRPHFLMFLVALTAGCAFGDITVPMPQQGATTGYSGGANRIVIVPTFVDKRLNQGRIGMKKNNYAMDTANVFPAENINQWLGTRLGNELKAAGFRIDAKADNNNAAKIQGFTHRLFIEPVVQWTTVDLETDLSVVIRVSRPDGLEAERRYFVKGLDQALVGLEDSFAASLRKASDELMKRVVADIINLLNRFPEPQVQP